MTGNCRTDDTETFAGGLYGVMKKIQKASDIRVQSGKKETAVIMVSTTYSNRRGDFSNHNNRYTTENSVDTRWMTSEKTCCSNGINNK